MGKLADAVDSLLEASVVGSFTRLGSAARRSLDHWDAADDLTLPSLEGRVIVITGASSGLGLATASALAARGHEVLLDIPMEPKTFPSDDPGPDTLLANARSEDTLRRLDTLLARATGYFGVTNYQGSKFLTSNTAMDAFSSGLRRRGLAFIDDGAAAQRGGGIPRASADRVIDEQPGVDTIGYQLAQLEQTATRRGSALGSGFGYSLTIRQVATWAQGLGARGLQLAPASAVTTRR